MKIKKFQPKPIQNQTIVITGATSGIGLATALLAAKKGAQVVLASRNGQDLKEIVTAIRNNGGEAAGFVTDVSKFEELEKLKNQALKTFGKIDTWVNNAGTSIYGYLSDTSLEEEKRLFDVNFWGIRHGCRVAVEALARDGGVIINLGSEVSGRSIPFQGIYAATKHAIKAYSDALRMELEKKGFPIAVSVIRPAGVDTPFTQHAVNHLPEGEPSLPNPVYHPDVVARAILKCARSPQRDIFVGGSSRLFDILDTLSPRFTDLFMGAMLFEKQSKGGAIPHRKEDEVLMDPAPLEGRITGGHRGRTRKTSLYTSMATHPWMSLATMGLLSIPVRRGIRKMGRSKYVVRGGVPLGLRH